MDLEKEFIWPRVLFCVFFLNCQAIDTVCFCFALVKFSTFWRLLFWERLVFFCCERFLFTQVFRSTTFFRWHPCFSFPLPFFCCSYAATPLLLFSPTLFAAGHRAVLNIFAVFGPREHFRLYLFEPSCLRLIRSHLVIVSLTLFFFRKVTPANSSPPSPKFFLSLRPHWS